MKSIPDTEKVEAAIREANERLKGARVGLTLWRKDNTLYLRGMMPDPKDPTRKKRRNLSTGLKANIRAVKVAEAKAHEAAGDIAYAHTPKFVQEREQLKPIGYYRDTFERDYRQKRGKDFNPDTWRREYANPLAKLPENEVPTAALLIAAIERESERETRKRVRYCNAYAKFAKHCGFEIDVKELRKGYDSSGTPRELPSTEVVFEWYERIRGSGAAGLQGVVGCVDAAIRVWATQSRDFSPGPGRVRGGAWAAGAGGQDGRSHCLRPLCGVDRPI